MRVSVYRVKNSNQLISSQDVKSLHKTDWLLGDVHYEESLEHANVQPAIIDPKAARMFELYASQGAGFARERLRFSLVLLAWLAYIQIQANGKRAFDLLVVLSLMPVVLPIMALTWAAIKLDSPGPAIFRQERVGKWGRRFTCYKFRSMYNGADAMKTELMEANEADEVVFKMKHDPRVTRVGTFIRKFSIDELPQLFNVIKGDMSLVGPRPPVPVELEFYPFDTFRRLETIPGLTGLQQVSGRSDLPFKRWVALDVEYIRHQSLQKDIEILIKTIPVAISGRGAY